MRKLKKFKYLHIVIWLEKNINKNDLSYDLGEIIRYWWIFDNIDWYELWFFRYDLRNINIYIYRDTIIIFSCADSSYEKKRYCVQKCTIASKKKYREQSVPYREQQNKIEKNHSKIIYEDEKNQK